MTTHAHVSVPAPRRVLATRHARWARASARWLAARGVRPNSVSMAGVGFALAAGAMFVLSSTAAGGARACLLVGAAGCVQLRLLCNLLDGMLAVEEGLKTKTGEIFNDLPDRAEDVLILIGAGYAVRHLAFGVTLGWAAALLAVLTAYVRVLGGSLGLMQHFTGPMAKQHRMFTLTLAALLAAAEAFVGAPPLAIAAGLAVIAVGSAATAARRALAILREAGAR